MKQFFVSVPLKCCSYLSAASSVPGSGSVRTDTDPDSGKWYGSGSATLLICHIFILKNSHLIKGLFTFWDLKMRPRLELLKISYIKTFPNIRKPKKFLICCLFHTKRKKNLSKENCQMSLYLFQNRYQYKINCLNEKI